MKQITVKQLKIDGIAQIKTKRQLLSQGIIEPIGDSFRFVGHMVSTDTGFASEMEKEFGKVATINSIGFDYAVLNTKGCSYTNWSWPLEAIAK